MKNIAFSRTRGWGASRGLSLVELMVALAIGVVLLLGLVEIFGASRAAFSAAEGASRNQEAGRFAMEFLRHDVRMAGHLGCLNENAYQSNAGALYNHAVNPSTNFTAAPFSLRVDYPIQGYNYVGTNPGQSVDLTAGISAAPGNGSWDPPLPAALGALIGGASSAVVGSDVLVVRFLSSEFVDSAFVNVAANQIQFNDPLDGPFFLEQAVYGVTNCRVLSVVQARSGPSGIIVNTGIGGLNAVTWSAVEDGYASPGTYIHRYNYIVYFVGIDAASGQPSLMRRNFDAGVGGSQLGVNEVLVEGIESLQFVFGIDNSTPKDDVVDVYGSASDVDDLAVPAGLDDAGRWRLVTTVRLGILARSPNAASVPQVGASSQLRAADSRFLPPDDNRVRQTYETLITIRNRVRN